jgi:hypothetical protein
VHIAKLAKQEISCEQIRHSPSARYRAGSAQMLRRRLNEPDGAEAFYDEIGVPNEAEPPRLNIAVAQILLHHIQETLPQCASVRGDKVSLNRSEHKRHT